MLEQSASHVLVALIKQNKFIASRLQSRSSLLLVEIAEQASYKDIAELSAFLERLLTSFHIKEVSED